MKNKIIVCNKKISELNSLCYPEERKPYKSLKDIMDLSFRDKVTPEKYIKARKQYRDISQPLYNYDDIYGFLEEEASKEYADIYLNNFKKLEKKLLSIGGYEVSFAWDCDLNDLKKILSRGQFLDGRKFKKTQGDPGRCHENSILGWEVNKDKAIVMCGYALSDDGYWVFHSWLINTMKNSEPLETTPINRCAYFGYALNLDECNEVLSYY